MAAALFNRAVDPAQARALSAGTEPAARVHPEVAEVMRELGVDLTGARPQKLTAELVAGAELLITMGCGEQCPLVPGLERADWALLDPMGKDLATVRGVRDEIASRVAQLLRERGLRGPVC
jgi:arsenate reductase